jgi:disulfide bond formation protein DsbB
MDVFTFSTFVAVLALVAIALAVIAVIVRVAAPAEVRSTLGDASRWLAWLVALTATVGSLLYSEVYHLEPCRLCWFQRIAMYPLAVILLVGAIRRDPKVRMYGLPLSIIGLGISIWHYFIQVFPDLEGGSCDPSNPCSARLVEVLGFVSIPFMAGAGFLLISVLLAFFSAHQSRSEIT